MGFKEIAAFCEMTLQQVQCNLDLVTILQRPFFNSLHRIIRFSDIMRFSDNMRFSDSFCGGQKCH